MNPNAVSESAFDEVHVLQQQPEMNCETFTIYCEKREPKTRINQLSG